MNERCPGVEVEWQWNGELPREAAAYRKNLESRRMEAQFKNIETCTYIKYQERMWEDETDVQRQG